jgi:hypothetical protein
VSEGKRRAADGSAGSTVFVPVGTYLVDRATLSGFGVLDAVQWCQRLHSALGYSTPAETLTDHQRRTAL